MKTLDRTAAMISVGMPVYNGEPYLESAILSVLCQTLGDFTLYISDNASTDRTEEICRALSAQDSRIVYSRNSTNIGAAKNYNRVFRLASSPYFRWFNADDEAAPDLHQKCFDVLEANPDAVLCCGHTRVIDAQGRVMSMCREYLDLRQERSDDRYLAFWRRAGLTNAIYGLMRTAAVGATGIMGSGSYWPADTNFMAELALQGKFIVIDEPLFFRRMHERAFSWDRSDEQRNREFWAGGGSQYVLPQWKRKYAEFAGVWRASIGVRAKTRLWRYLTRAMITHRSELGRELWDVTRDKIGRLCLSN